MVKKVKARKTRKQKGGVGGWGIFGKEKLSTLMDIIRNNPTHNNFVKRESEVNTDVIHFLNEQKDDKELCMVRQMGYSNGSKTALDYVFAETYTNVLKTLLDRGILKCPNININNVILYRLKKIGTLTNGDINFDAVTWFNIMADTVLKEIDDQVKLKELVIGFAKVLRNTYLNTNATQGHLKAILMMVKPKHNHNEVVVNTREGYKLWLQKNPTWENINLDLWYGTRDDQGIYRTLWNKVTEKKDIRIIDPDRYMRGIGNSWERVFKSWKETTWKNWWESGDDYEPTTGSNG